MSNAPRMLPPGTRVVTSGDDGKPVMLTAISNVTQSRVGGFYTAICLPDAPMAVRREFHFEDILRDCPSRGENAMLDAFHRSCQYCGAPPGEPCVAVISAAPPAGGYHLRRTVDEPCENEPPDEPPDTVPAPPETDEPPDLPPPAEFD